MDILPNEKLGCHRTAFEKSCRELVASGRCERWRYVRGKDPQSEQILDHWDCADNLQVPLTIALAQEVRQLAAAIESARNEQAMNSGAVAAGLLAIADGATKRNGKLLGPQAARLEGARRLAAKVNGEG